MLRDDDPSFNLDLRFRLIEDGNQLTNGFDVFPNVRDYQRVGLTQDFDRTEAGKTTLDDRKNSLIAAAASRIATGTTTKTQIRGTAGKATSRTGCRRQRPGCADII